MDPAVLRTLLATPTVSRTTFFAQYLNEPGEDTEPAADPASDADADSDEPAAAAEPTGDEPR